ncbi:MAG: hypothetical protein ACLRS8_00895 [Parabacteroides merdae]
MLWEIGNFGSFPLLTKSARLSRKGDEVETATRLYKKYVRLAAEYYKDEIEADEIHEGNIFENLGE